jgi:nucleoside-diphosphate-sugar epimerase
MKFFITGRNGFIAKNMAIRLEKEGHLLGFSSQGDNVTLKLTEFKPDVILHLAMEGRDNDNMVQSNILLTHEILEYCRHNTVRKLVIFGSSSEYGRKNHSITETDLLEPTTMYEATKGSATLLSRAYAYSYGIKTVVIRPMSIYGPHEKPYKLMHKLFDKNIQFMNEAYHDWSYIDDFVEGTMKVTEYESDELFDIVNIGLGVQRSNTDVLRITEKLMNHSFNLVEDNTRGKSYDSMNWVCDPTHLKNKYGYECKTTLEEGLKKYHDWFKNSLMTEQT